MRVKAYLTCGFCLWCRRMGVALESCGTDTAVPVRRALCAGLFPTASRLLGTAVAGHGDPGTAEYQMVRLAGPGVQDMPSQ